MSAHKHKKRNPFKPKPLVVLTLLSLTATAQAAHHPNGPFADTPLHLQSTSTTTGAQGVKPNVLLQIDDSGSMGWNIKGVQDGSKERMNVAVAALKDLVTNPEYQPKVNWNMITLCNSDGSNRNNRVYSNDSNWRFGLTSQELMSSINKLKPLCGTPSTSRYMDSVHILRAALDQPGTYRCQKSYVVIFSDGEPNDYIEPLTGNHSTGFYTSRQVTLNYAAASGGALGNPFFAHKAHNGQTSQYRFKASSNSGTTYEQGKNIFVQNDAWTRRTFVTGSFNASVQTVLSPRYGLSRQYTAADAGNQPDPRDDARCTQLGACSTSFWGNNRYSLNFLAESVYHNDLKTGGVDAAGKSWDDDSAGPDHHNNKQTITTFAIGLGLDAPYLDYGSTGNNYKAFNAYSKQDLDAAFKAIFDEINNQNKAEPASSFSSISPTLSGDETDLKVPSLAAAVRLDVKTGSSEVRFYDVETRNGTTVVKDSYKTPLFNTRRVILNTGASNTWLESFAGNNTFFGIPSAASNSNEWKQAMIPWIARSKPDDHADLTSANNALKYRVRSGASPDARSMGDVIAAPIHSFGPQKHGRQQYFITAANDGMVYLFESSSNRNHPYELKVNYIPGGMERESATDTLAKHFADIVAPNYVVDPTNHPHRYMINGDMVIRTSEKNDRFPQRHFLAGNMGQGGRGMYSLNLGGRDTRNNNVGLDAGESNWLTSIPLFETPKGATNVLGYTIGAPQIGRLAQTRSLSADHKMTADLADVRYGTFLGSGTRHPNQVSHQAGGIVNDNTEAALYIYNSLTNENVGITPSGSVAINNPMTSGTLMAKIPVPNASNNRGGLMQPTLVDMDFDGTVDIAYAADYRGGLYRFDFRTGYGSASVHKIFQAQDKQVVTSAPAVYRREDNKYVVIFGTGSDLYQADQTNKDVQSVYGIYDDLTTVPTEKTAANLLQQNMNDATNAGSSGAQTRTVSNNDFDPAQHQGWYFNLPAGERVVVKPDLLLKTVVFTTRNYSVSSNTNSGTNTASNDPCIASSHSQQSSGESWVMQVKADNGGNLSNSDSMDYAYIDFLGENTGRDKKFRPTTMFAGYKAANGGIITYVLTVGGNDPNKIGNVGNAYSLNGDAGGTGTDPALTPGGQNIRQCFNGSNHSIYLSDSSAQQGVNNPLGIYGKACAANLARIGWREIF